MPQGLCAGEAWAVSGLYLRAGDPVLAGRVGLTRVACRERMTEQWVAGATAARPVPAPLPPPQPPHPHCPQCEWGSWLAPPCPHVGLALQPGAGWRGQPEPPVGRGHVR